MRCATMATTARRITFDVMQKAPSKQHMRCQPGCLLCRTWLPAVAPLGGYCTPACCESSQSLLFICDTHCYEQLAAN